MQRWLKATSAPFEDYGSVLSLVDSITSSPLPSRTPALRGWRARRTDRAAIELEAEGVLVIQSAFVPEVLQTPSYMNRFTRMSTGRSKQSVNSQMSTQISRQEILHKSNSRLEIVIFEGALRRRIGSRSVMLNQLDWIAAIVRRQQVDLAVLPTKSEAGEDCDTGIEIYLSPDGRGDNLVMTASGDGPNSDQTVAQRCIDQFRAYQRHSWRGDQAIEFVEGLAREMGSGESSSGDAGEDRDGA
nr:Scr1 family TA system antitoxin-like transcriptional regulator [Pseudonocardia sp. ICBG601]